MAVCVCVWEAKRSKVVFDGRLWPFALFSFSDGCLRPFSLFAIFDGCLRPFKLFPFDGCLRPFSLFAIFDGCLRPFSLFRFFTDACGCFHFSLIFCRIAFFRFLMDACGRFHFFQKSSKYRFDQLILITSSVLG